MSKVAAGTKVAVVTGGTSGIGLAAVKALREKGCTVYALSRRGEIPCDVSEVNSVRAAVQTVLDREGRIVQRNLRGADLEKAVKQLVGE